MKDNIIVIGGYGAVGQIICKELANYFPYKVYAAGRSMQKANAFSLKTNGKVLPLELDITKPFSKEYKENTKMIIMCLDQPDTNFVKKIIEYGIDYVDITAGNDFLRSVEALSEETISKGSTALLSVGLTPGLSNLMASEASNQLDSTENLNIAIMLGLGDHHGSAAIQWTLDNMNKEFTWYNNGKLETASSFQDGKTFYFGKELGKMKAYRFPFSDQHTIAKTLGIPVVKTRMCFDSTFLTRCIALMKTIGLLNILRYPKIQKLMEYAMMKLPLGSDKYALKVEASGRKDGKNVKVELLIQGNKEAEITGLVAAAAAKELYEKEHKKGVYHIEQLFDFTMLPSSIRSLISQNSSIIS